MPKVQNLKRAAKRFKKTAGVISARAPIRVSILTKMTNPAQAPVGGPPWSTRAIRCRSIACCGHANGTHRDLGEDYASCKRGGVAQMPSQEDFEAGH